MFHLKGNPNCYTWTPSRTKRRNQWQYWILAAVSRCCRWCTAWNRCGRNFSCFFRSVSTCHRQTLMCSEVLLAVGVLCHFLVRIRITKCFTNSSKRFRWEIMFENEHTFCSWIYHVCTAQILRNWRGQRPSNQGDLESNVTGEVGRECYTGVGLLLISLMYRSTWLLWVVFETVHRMPKSRSMR
jgi:hypothetical protein